MAISKNFVVTDGIDIGTTANVGSALTVGGTTSITGNTTVSGTLGVTSNATFSSNVSMLATLTAPSINVGSILAVNSTILRISSTTGAYGLSANGTVGSAGQVLTSNGTSTYWATPNPLGVTNVATGSGLSGGPITSTGTIAIVANTGIVANATGVYVNSAYIATITANSASFIGTLPAANVVSNTQLQSNLANYAQLAGATFTGGVTVPSSFTVNAEGAEGGQIILKKGSTMTTGGDVYVDAIGSMFRVYDNNGTTFPQYTMNFTTGTLTGPNGTFWHSGYMGAGSTLDADLLDGQQGSYYLNAGNLNAGTVPYARIPTNIVNTTASFTLNGVQTYSANVIYNANATLNANLTIAGTTNLILAPGASIYANGAIGGTSQVLTSNSSGGTYWNIPITSVSPSSGLSGGGSSGALSLAVLAGDGIVANATGTHVNATYIATLTANNTAYFGDQLPSYYRNASNLNTGTVAAARLGSGTASSSTFLRGDNTWQTLSTAVTITNGTGITGGGTGSTFTLGVTNPVLRHITTGYTGGGRVSVRADAPTSPNQGDIWFDLAATTGYTQNLATAGYTKLPNGLYIQWGVSGSIAQDSGGYTSFYTAFPNECFAVMATRYSGTAGSGEGSVTAYIYSTTQFYIYNGEDVTSTFKYIAIGY